MIRGLLVSAGLLALAFAARAAAPPQAEIANGTVRARVYLPDPVDGYYRATGFDWSGVVSSLEWNGHSYFGQWFARYDPKINDAVMGPTLAIEHSLKNTGRKTIQASVYEHNFYMLDRQPSGPDFRVVFPFAPQSGADWKGPAELGASELRYLTLLQERQTVFGELRGYGDSAKDYDIRVENLSAGAGVRRTGNRPMAKLMFWSIRNKVCPEAYVEMSIEPERESTWRIDYEFYEARR